jgi:hypothetical protein
LYLILNQGEFRGKRDELFESIPSFPKILFNFPRDTRYFIARWKAEPLGFMLISLPLTKNQE